MCSARPSVVLMKHFIIVSCLVIGREVFVLTSVLGNYMALAVTCRYHLGTRPYTVRPKDHPGMVICLASFIVIEQMFMIIE